MIGSERLLVYVAETSLPIFKTLSNDDYFLKLSSYLNMVVIHEKPEAGYFFDYNPETKSLGLCRAQTKDLPLVISFQSLYENYTKQKVISSRDLLAKALGLKRGTTVFDGTLGLGQDAYKLCFLGAKVIGAESNPWVYALLANALYREQGVLAVNQLSVNFGSSIDHYEDAADVIYLDPMFVHKKKALPKKNMQYLADLITTKDDDVVAVLRKGIAGKKRVVVKRSSHADVLGGIRPKRNISGKMIRFDIY